MQILNSVYAWAEETEREQLQEWICMIDIEQQVLSGKMQKEDAIQATEECRKQNQNTRLSSLNNLEPASSSAIVEESLSQIQIIPNPAKDFFQIVLDRNEENDMVFELYDINGKKQLDEMIHKDQKLTSVSTAALSSGVYFYRITNSNGTIGHGKLAVIKE